MTETIYEHSELNAEFLRKVFDDAGFIVEIDDDGDIRLKNTDGRSCYVVLSKSGPERVSWLSMWRGSEDKTAAQRFEFANKVNQKLIGPQAWVTDRGGISFQHVLFLTGGVTRKNLIHTTHRFLSMEASAVGLDEDDVIA